MKTLLCIETSSKNCSIAIIRINEKQNQPFLLGFSNNFSEEYSHSEQLTTIIKDMLTENKLGIVLILFIFPYRFDICEKN